MNLRRSPWMWALFITLLPAFAWAQEYEFRTLIGEDSAQWDTTDSLFTDWERVSENYDCQAWEPPPESVDYGDNYIQYRDCQFDEERVETLREYDPVGDQYRVVGQETHERTSTDTESRQQVGTYRNWLIYASTFTEWVDFGEPNDHTPWRPVPNQQVADFEQNRDYDQPQERYEQERERDEVTGDIREVGDPIRHTQEDDRNEVRPVVVEATEWSDTDREQHTAWSPVPSSQTESYTQTRSYQQNQERTWSYTADGQLLHSRVEDGALTSQEETRPVDVSVDEWSDTDREQHTAWAPFPTDETDNYTQTRSYQQNQEREWTYAADGQVLHTRMEDGALSDQEETRPVLVTSSDWSHTDREQHTAWSPAPSNETEDFTQTRQYQQNRERTWTYRAGGQELHTRVESGLLSDQSESRTVTTTVSDWSNTEQTSAHGDWLPTPGTQQVDYTQSQTYTQHRERTWTYTAGGSVLDTRVESGTLTNQVDTRAVAVAPTDYTNQGDPYACEEFGPSTDTVDYGENFVQSRDCKQEQVRDWVHTVAGDELHREEQQRTVTVTQNRNATGTYRNWVEHESSFTNWQNDGARYAYTPWSPATADQTSDFTQTRDYQQDQTRLEQPRERDTVTGDIRTNGDEILRERTIEGTESRLVTVDQGGWSNTTTTAYSDWSPTPANQTAAYEQTRSYTQNRERTWTYTAGGNVIDTRLESGSLTNQPQSRDVAVSPSSWSNVGGNYDCGSWSPAPDTVDYGESFTQTRDCKQNQSRTWTHTVGSDTIHTRDQARTIDVEQSRDQTGTKRNWESYTSTFTNWSNDGGRFGYESWGPVAANQTADFNQTRDYDQKQTRYEQPRERDSITGDIRDDGDPILRTRTISGTETRSVAVNATGWSHTSRSGYTSWSPSVDGRTADFTQSRTYTQHRERTWSYVAGSTTLHTRTETDSLSNQTQSRSVAANANSWSNTSQSNTSSWSPTPGNQTSNYGQSQTYTQNQERTWTYTAGSTNVGSWKQTRSLSNQERNRSVAVNVSNWSNTGGNYDCGNWGPAPDTVDYGESFTQTRDCKQNQVRTWTHTTGGSTIHTRDQARTINVTQSRSNTGTKRNWESYTPSYTAWSSTGTHSFGSYSPAAANQTSDFSQSQPYKRDQERERQNRERDSITGDIRNVGSPITETRTIDQSRSRAVSVSSGSWAFVRNKSFDGWSPTASNQTSNFTQSEGFVREERRQWTYVTGSTTLHTRYEHRDLDRTRSRTVAVSNSGWNNTGGNYDCGNWSPHPDTVDYGESFTQTRDCKQNQVRDWTYVASNSTIHTRQQTRTITATQSRSNTGTKRNWESYTPSYTSWTTLRNHDHGTFSPAASTQTSNFTQSRPYKRDEERYRQNRERDSVTGDIRDSGSAVRETRTVDLTQSRTVTASVGSWAYYRNKSFDGWSPTASTQTSSFSQSEGYIREERRLWTYTAWNSTLHTRYQHRDLNRTRSRTVDVSAGSWAHVRFHSYGNWEPSPGNQTSGYRQYRDRTREERRFWDYQVSGSRIHSRYQYRNVNADYDRWVSVSVGSWSNYGTWSNYVGWSPHPSTVDEGQQFYQERSYDQPQRRYWTHTGHGNTIHTREQTRTTRIYEYRVNYGTKVVSGEWSSSSTVSSGHNSNPTSNTTAATGTCSPVGAVHEYGAQYYYQGMSHPQWWKIRQVCE